MRFRQLHPALMVIGLAVFLLGLWVVSAGTTTVYRTLAYNFSGIDDYRIFPHRIMTAPARPFRFAEGDSIADSALRVDFGGRKEVSLSELLAKTDTTAFLVIQNGRIIVESYYDGYDRTTPSMSFSMAKSFFSILTGCALADGYLKSVVQPVTDYVPELRSQGFAAVTLKHLLQMTSGIDYAETEIPLGIHVRYYYTDHLERKILKLKLKEPPGMRFEYKSGDVFLLTLALKRALENKSITEYMQERLWHPLGMEHDGIWSIDHAPDGLEKTGCCLAATARDFAKLGMLYLNKGTWEGRQIVPADWVHASTQADLSIGSAWNYQRMWWKVDQKRPDFMANGHLGQFLYINPIANAVIVRLGKSMGGLNREEWAQVFISLSEGGMK